MVADTTNMGFKPQDSLGFLVNRTGRSFRNTVQYNLKEAGLNVTMEQGMTLMKLVKFGGCSQNDLAGFINKDKTTITRLLENMEKSDLIRKESDPNDKRSKLLYVTDYGKDIQLQIEKVIVKTLKQATLDIDPSDVDVCKSVLNKVFNNLGSSESEGFMCE